MSNELVDFCMPIIEKLYGKCDITRYKCFPDAGCVSVSAQIDHNFEIESYTFVMRDDRNFLGKKYFKKELKKLDFKNFILSDAYEDADDCLKDKNKYWVLDLIIKEENFNYKKQLFCK